MTLHANLAAIRKTLGLTQDEVAQRSGIGKKVLSSWESGRRIRSMRVWQLVRLAEVYGAVPGNLIPDGEIVNTRPEARRVNCEPLPKVSREILRGLGR